jgi:hypothetical protein
MSKCTVTGLDLVPVVYRLDDTGYIYRKKMDNLRPIKRMIGGKNENKR